MRWILLIAGIGIVLGIFFLTWLPDKLRGLPLRRRVQPSARVRAAVSGEAGVTVDGMVEQELQKLGQLVIDNAADGQSSPVHEIGAIRPQPAAVDKVFSLYLIAPKGVPFRGPVLLDAMADAGLEYGEMQIFNRLESQDGQQQLVFSLAGIREPGTFDLSAMQEFTTDGLVLFIQVPGQVDAVKAFKSMVEAGCKLANRLDGTLYDSNNSVLTNQTIGHMREEVIACQLQQRFSKRAS